MVKDKLQICLSFKHTEEEEALYSHIISQSDKSAFLKNLIRNNMNDVSPMSYDMIQPEVANNNVATEDATTNISHGKQTINKFLA